MQNTHRHTKQHEKLAALVYECKGESVHTPQKSSRWIDLRFFQSLFWDILVLFLYPPNLVFFPTVDEILYFLDNRDPCTQEYCPDCKKETAQMPSERRDGRRAHQDLYTGIKMHGQVITE